MENFSFSSSLLFMLSCVFVSSVYGGHCHDEKRITRRTRRWSDLIVSAVFHRQRQCVCLNYERDFEEIRSEFLVVSSHCFSNINGGKEFTHLATLARMNSIMEAGCFIAANATQNVGAIEF
jgi:hypothetical protein